MGRNNLVHTINTINKSRENPKHLEDFEESSLTQEYFYFVCKEITLANNEQFQFSWLEISR